MSNIDARLKDITESVKKMHQTLDEREFFKVIASVFLDNERKAADLQNHWKLVSEQGDIIDSMRAEITKNYHNMRTAEHDIVSKLSPYLEQLVENVSRTAMAKQKSISASHAVSHRADQQLKPNWLKHVRYCVDTGIEIKNINSFLEYPGYDRRLEKVDNKTLKKWAKEAIPSLKFKPGAPKK